MTKRNRTQLVLGVILILAAAWLIAVRIFPQLGDIVNLPIFDWPMWIILTGAAFLVLGLLVGAPGMAVPACIIAGIGGILYYQNATNDWTSWSYLWTLIPGFVGIGSILAGVLGEDTRRSVRSGANALVFSVIAFAIFSTLFGGWTILGSYAQYVPIALLFILGIWFIVRGILRNK